uniref:NADH dehydrogenase [ubiquinone] 1 alpha subcomplex assembly factor 3 n=1 Tax=Petromyzon marinus TaxID=7757 RepID=S4REK2_PETMA
KVCVCAATQLNGLHRRLLTPKTCAQVLGVKSHRCAPSDDDLYEKTTVTMLQRDSPNTIFVDSYGLHGFTVNGNRVIGPCAIIPHAIIQWNVGSWKDISEESLSLFYLLEPRIEILVLGTGDRVERLDAQLLRFMTRQGVAVEVQDTGHACSTFNFLVNDRRLVAAGLIPPTKLE